MRLLVALAVAPAPLIILPILHPVSAPPDVSAPWLTRVMFSLLLSPLFIALSYPVVVIGVALFHWWLTSIRVKTWWAYAGLCGASGAVPVFVRSMSSQRALGDAAWQVMAMLIAGVAIGLQFWMIAVRTKH